MTGLPPGPLGYWSLKGAVDCRITKSGGKTSSLIASGSSSKLSSRALAVLAISTMGCVTTVSAGSRWRAHNGSSKPTIERAPLRPQDFKAGNPCFRA
jgi:hypothetical protein